MGVPVVREEGGSGWRALKAGVVSRLGGEAPGAAAGEEGRFGLDGAPAINPSGGLLGRGSAVGATGIAQAVEVVSQLRGEVPGPRAVAGARIGITDTHAGVGSLCAVDVLGGAA